MSEQIYLDAAASTPIAPEALAATIDAMARVGNPAAAHQPGRDAARMMSDGRASVAELLHVGPGCVVFTSTATEANSLAIGGVAVEAARSAIVTTTTEHPSVLEAVLLQERNGTQCTLVKARESGEIDLEALAKAVTRETALVSVHAANNETGVVQPIPTIAEIARAHGALLHVDASQLMAWGEAPMLDAADLITVSSHKMHGPQGAAALVIKHGARSRIQPQILGGGQEHGLRSGTPNLAAIVGFGVAVELARDSGIRAATVVRRLRERLQSGLVAALGDVAEHGSTAAARLPGILNVAVGAARPDSPETEALLARVPQVAASTGSACRAGVPGPSPVLLAMGISEHEAARSIRFSLSRYSTEADVSAALAMLVPAYQDLQDLMADRPTYEGDPR